MCEKVLCTFPRALSMSLSCITTEQYQNQEIYIGIIYTAYANFVIVIHVLICACVCSSI